VRKFSDLLKHKADGDEIDGLNSLVNELYEKWGEIEKRFTGVGDGSSSPQNANSVPRISSLVIPR
jgi:hypothetical protein